MISFNYRRRARNLVVHSRRGHAALRMFRSSEVFIRPDAQLMIEGYPRSGNSFAEAAFYFAQGDTPVPLAHHTHSAGHVLEAISRGLPVLLLYRDPIDAAASFMEECQGQLAPKVALREYVQFHRPLLGHTNNIVLGSFATVIEDFPMLIAQLNKRFGCSFGSFEQSPKNVQEIRELVDKISLRRSKILTRYSSEKDVSEKAARAQTLQRYKAGLMQSARLAPTRTEAEETYRQMCELQAAQFGAE